jgi:hypothetical protein
MLAMPLYIYTLRRGGINKGQPNSTSKKDYNYLTDLLCAYPLQTENFLIPGHATNV